VLVLALALGGCGLPALARILPAGAACVEVEHFFGLSRTRVCRVTGPGSAAFGADGSMRVTGGGELAE
jgi:hypothetical protein